MAKRRINGEGSVYAQRDSEGNVIRWIAQLAVGVNENGSIKRKRAYAQTKTEAVQLLEKMKFDCKTGILVDKSSITLHDLGLRSNESGLNSMRSEKALTIAAWKPSSDSLRFMICLCRKSRHKSYSGSLSQSSTMRSLP